MNLLVLDGNSIVNRAFYGIKLLTTKSGYYTNCQKAADVNRSIAAKK